VIWFWWALAVIAVGAAGAVLIRRRRSSGGLDGVHGFRRHMDALSSDSRRDVVGRLQPQRQQPHDYSGTSSGIAGQPAVGGRMQADDLGDAADDQTASSTTTGEHDNNGDMEAKG
jgi:hypothetical protein